MVSLYYEPKWGILGEPVKVQVPVYDPKTKQKVEDYTLEFWRSPHKYVMHRALVRQWANRRLGTVKTKKRSEVRGGGRKPWPQKHTGRARHGSIRSPLWKGGGVVFGPQPTDWSQKMNKKERKLALYSVIQVKAPDMVAITEIPFERPSTKEFINTLSGIGISQGKVLVIYGEADEPKKELLVKSARNLPENQLRGVIKSYNVNIEDFLSADKILVTRNALEDMKRLFIDEVNERAKSQLERMK